MSKVKRTPNFVPFWYWSNWKHSTRTEILGTWLELKMEPKPYPALDRLSYGHGPLSPAEIPLIEADLHYTRQADDCPWPVDTMFSVSDRLRKILEEAAPGNCQFFPMKLWHDGKPCDLVYWALYADSIDCADQEKSGRSGGLICDPVIVEERVPQSTHIFRVWNDPVKNFSGSAVLVRDGLRRILKREKVIGCFFYEPPKPFPPPPVYESAARMTIELEEKFGFKVEPHCLDYVLCLTEVPPGMGKQVFHDRIFLRLIKGLEAAGKVGEEAKKVFGSELERINIDILKSPDQWFRP